MGDWGGRNPGTKVRGEENVSLWGGGARNPGTKVRGEESVSLGGTYRTADYSILYPVSAGGDFCISIVDFYRFFNDWY